MSEYEDSPPAEGELRSCCTCPVVPGEGYEIPNCPCRCHPKTPTDAEQVVRACTHTKRSDASACIVCVTQALTTARQEQKERDATVAELHNHISYVIAQCNSSGNCGDGIAHAIRESK